MKKRINLFSKKKQQEPIPTLAITLRSYGILFSSITIVLAIISGIVLYFQYQQLNQLDTEVSQLQQFISSDSQIQGNIVFFVNKKEQLRKFLNDDADFEYYYTILQEQLSQSGADTKLESMSLDIDGNTSFIIQFTEFDSSERLMNLFESETFLNNFEILKLQSFMVGQQNTGVFELKFGGKFKKQGNEANNNRS